MIRPGNRRIEFNQLLKKITGCENVYFQPPESLKIKYPAIIYNRDDMKLRKADDQVYTATTRYNVVVVDKNPDSELIHKLLKLPMIYYGRHYTADNLNYDTFEVFY